MLKFSNSEPTSLIYLSRPLQPGGPGVYTRNAQRPSAWPCPCPIYNTFFSFVPQVQEAASRGLKFVGAVPQYQSSANSAGSSRSVPVATSAVDARDGKHTLGDHASLENDASKAADMDAAAATARVNQRPGSTGEVPSAQPGIPTPSEETEADEIPLRELSPALDGPDGDPSNGHEELLSRSKCQHQEF